MISHYENSDNIAEYSNFKVIKSSSSDAYAKAPPSTRHQLISTYICREISLYIYNNKGACQVFAAPFAVYLNGNDANYVEPDISVVCDPKKIKPKGCYGSPDWVIEIVSPSTRSNDYITKKNNYLNAKVKEYWIVDPLSFQISVFDFEHNSKKQYTFYDIVPCHIYQGFSIDFSEILLQIKQCSNT